MKLIAKGNYRNDPLNVVYRKGDTIEVDDALGEFLLRDAPGTFEKAIATPAKAGASPPADKAVKEPAAKK